MKELLHPGSALPSPVLGQGSLEEKMARSIAGTRDYYLAEQHREGYWWYELESNVTMTAQYLMLLSSLDRVDPVRKEKIGRYIRNRQRQDGGWAIHYGGAGDVSASVEAYFALKLAGYDASLPFMEKARRFILGRGGVEATRVFTRIFLALFGQFDWKGIPSLPVEIMLLPPWAPCNIYGFSSWARSTLVPLALLLDAKPVFPVASSAGVKELYVDPGKIPTLSIPTATPFCWKRFFVSLNDLLKVLEDKPGRFLRSRARQRAIQWIMEHEEPTGDWAGIQPAMVNSVLALSAAGYDLSSLEIRRGLAALERFTIESDRELVLQPCISPVWDTGLTGLALLAAGLYRGHPSLQKARSWLLHRQILSRGDWAIKKRSLEPGGWAFEFSNNWYPDVDDTAVVLLFLLAGQGHGDRGQEAVDRGIRWVLGMQGKDGGWAAFDTDNDREIVNQIPFADMEAMLDPSTADVTGRVLTLLGKAGYRPSDRKVGEAIDFLKQKQEKDGLWWGRWGVNYVYGTWSVLSGLRSVGEDMEKPYVRRAISTLKAYQNPDGGWGECCESYGDPHLRLTGKSTPSQTAWALMSLIAAGHHTCDQARKGVLFLLERQGEDGTWEEDEFTATGFPKYFMLKYHNYRNCFPLMALGQFLNGSRDGKR